MTYFNVSYAATKSLHAIDDWLATCQANVSGSVRVAFKESVLTYKGSNTIITRAPNNFAAGEMIGEQTLVTGDTQVNWKQGELVATSEDTHFGIQGDGFFLVTEQNQPLFNGTIALPANGGYFLTRDGEFHWGIVAAISAVDPVLLTKEGLIVQSDISDGAFVGNSDNFDRFILKSEFDNLNYRPTVVQPSYDAPGAGAIATVVDYNELQYSQYGATYFEAPSANSIKTLINGSGGNTDRFSMFPLPPPTQPSGSLLREKYLESSNTDSARNLTEMAALGKMYNGFVQLIKAYNGTLDEILGFIR